MRKLALIAFALIACGCFTNQNCSSRPTDPMCQDIDSGSGDGGSGEGGVDAPAPDVFYPCGRACTSPSA